MGKVRQYAMVDIGESDRVHGRTNARTHGRTNIITKVRRNVTTRVRAHASLEWENMSEVCTRGHVRAHDMSYSATHGKKDVGTHSVRRYARYMPERVSKDMPGTSRYIEHCRVVMLDDVSQHIPHLMLEQVSEHYVSARRTCQRVRQHLSFFSIAPSSKARSP